MYAPGFVNIITIKEARVKIFLLTKKLKKNELKNTLLYNSFYRGTNRYQIYTYINKYWKKNLL